MRKLLSFLLAAALCLSVSVAVLPATAAAVSSDDISVSAAVLNMMGALGGSGSGSLDLNGTLTRAQFCKIAVVLMGKANSAAQYSGFTKFPDVPSSSWASGYINYAVSIAQIIKGYPDGTFHPDELMTYGQSVTVLVRMLGYTNADVGNSWPDSYVNKADQIGLSDGTSLYAGTSVTRGEAAVLFTNLLNCTVNGSDLTYLETLPDVTAVKNVFLVSSDAETDEGEKGAVKVAGTESGTYLPVNHVPAELVGRYGTLLLNASGKALTFVPSSSGETVVSIVADTTAKTITCANGKEITISSSTKFYLDGELATYSDSWIDVDQGMMVSAYYTEGGTVKSVLVMAAEEDSDTVIVVTGGSYTAPAGSVVYKNGVEVDSSDICKYDVITASADLSTYNVSDIHITGRYEDAYPNDDSPETVTVLGQEFDLLDSAVSAMEAFKIGDTITLLLTSGHNVAGVVAAGTVRSENYGIVESASSSSATVALLNGITVSGKTENDYSDYVGKLITVSSGKTGYMSLHNLSGQSKYGTLDISERKLGTSRLSACVRVFDSVGSSAVIESALEDIAADQVASADVQYAAYDEAGKVNLLLLNDVTGDAYIYGEINMGAKTESSGGMSVTNTTVSVTNADGASEELICVNTGLYSGIYAGIAATPDGGLAGVMTLSCLTGISRASFEEDADGNLYVALESGMLPVSDNVQAYITKTGTWTTLSRARSSSDDLTVYYDRTVEQGGKVRIVVAN
jgi:hypothetical protein